MVGASWAFTHSSFPQAPCTHTSDLFSSELITACQCHNASISETWRPADCAVTDGEGIICRGFVGCRSWNRQQKVDGVHCHPLSRALHTKMESNTINPRSHPRKVHSWILLCVFLQAFLFSYPRLPRLVSLLTVFSTSFLLESIVIRPFSEFYFSLKCIPELLYVVMTLCLVHIWVFF